MARPLVDFDDGECGLAARTARYRATVRGSAGRARRPTSPHQSTYNLHWAP